jgi:hypothetical protein
MHSIPAFSKKMTTGGIVTGTNKTNYQRAGFTPHVSLGPVQKVKAVPHMAASYPTKSTLTRTTPKGNPAHPGTKSGSGQAAKAVAAFSKKKLSGTPKKK